MDFHLKMVVIYRAVANVYPTYLHFDIRILHTDTIEDEKVASIRAGLPGRVWLHERANVPCRTAIWELV